MQVHRTHSVILILLLIATAVTAQTTDARKSIKLLRDLSDSLEGIVERVAPSVVQIFATGYVPGSAETAGSIIARQRSSGSGVIVDPDGYIITNAHVVSNSLKVQVRLPERYERDQKGNSILKPPGLRIDAQVLGIDLETDLAVLKIAEKNLPALQLGNSDQLRQGQLVLAFGSPLGLRNSVTMGVVSSVARQLQPEDPMVYVQTDAPINPGNSGGPLLDTDGRVVGINTFIFSQSGGNEGIGFAAPVNIVKTVYQQIREHGRVRRGHIGVYAQPITPLIAHALGLSRDWGVVLGDVYPNGPAFKAGLQPGDLIFALDGKLMENGRQFDVNIYSRRIGDKVRLEVLRGDMRTQFEVQVMEKEDDPYRFLNLVDPQRNLVPRLGILAVEVDNRIESRLGGLRRQFGLLVAAVSDETPSADDPLMSGDVIFTANGEEILGLKGLNEVLERLKPGDGLVMQIQRNGRLQYLGLEVE